MNQCGYCLGLMNQEQNLACNGMCRQHFHPTCVNWSPHEYNAYKSISSKIKWFCTACDEAIEEISSMYSHSSINSVNPKHEYKTNVFGKLNVPEIHRDRSKSPVKMSNYNGVPESYKETAQNKISNHIESKVGQSRRTSKYLPPKNTANIQENMTKPSPWFKVPCPSEQSSSSDCASKSIKTNMELNLQCDNTNRSKSLKMLNNNGVPESRNETALNKRSNHIESKVRQSRDTPKHLPLKNTANIQEDMTKPSPCFGVPSPSKLHSSSECASKNSIESPERLFISIGTNTEFQPLQSDNTNDPKALLEQKTLRDIKIMTDDLERTKTYLVKSLMVRIGLEKLRLDSEENRLKLLKDSLTGKTSLPEPAMKISSRSPERKSSKSPEKKKSPSPINISPVNSARMSPMRPSLQDGQRSRTNSPQRTIIHKRNVTANKKSFGNNRKRKT